ncbi:class I SAM-dependent methyltransferase [Streptomyces zingiberis]|uniref:Class I SAM-dependent methyltransferase n=1 Tax=Streptomyces zingiberis TaxID=2053010 RepID=A0ABX1BN07_9ACTN|nr:class I SAM-dependent methyltransferase [Streptomyces zingiberis]NJP99120.1 class I SAM-dependent methyltransferase [Streptomyces zingiberis]
MHARPAPSDDWPEPEDSGDLDTFRYGQDTIREIEVSGAGDVTGRTLLHLRCRSGLDTLSWARHGARHVVGLDSSEAAVEAARELAADLGLGPDRAAFVTAPLYDAAQAVPDPAYDIVHTGAGTLSRLPDLRRWAETAASLVAPGGILHLTEFHPLTGVLDDETGARIVRDHFARDRYEHEQGPDVHPDFDTQAIRHPLGEVVTAVAATGLRVDLLREHDITRFRRFGSLEPRSPSPRRPAGPIRVPLLYTLRATRV